MEAETRTVGEAGAGAADLERPRQDGTDCQRSRCGHGLDLMTTLGRAAKAVSEAHVFPGPGTSSLLRQARQDPTGRNGERRSKSER